MKSGKKEKIPGLLMIMAALLVVVVAGLGIGKSLEREICSIYGQHGCNYS